MSAQWTICRDTGFPARGGACVVHGGDACLVEVVPLKELLIVQSELLAERDSGASERRAKELETENAQLRAHNAYQEALWKANAEAKFSGRSR